MEAIETGLLAPHRRAITADEFYRMGEAGIFAEDDRIELIEGELVEMAPISDEHATTVDALTALLVRAVGDGGVVSVQNPVRLSQRSLPQPDLVVYKPDPDFYRGRARTAADVLLIVEVAHSSVAYDRETKAPLYARHGIPEYWIARLDQRCIEVHREPGPAGYASRHTLLPGEQIEPLLLPGVVIAVSKVLGR